MWRYRFGVFLVSCRYGFEQLRAAVASIPGVQLTTRGTNVIISRRSRAPLPHSSGLSIALLPSPQRLSPLAESPAQVLQQPTSANAVSPSSLARLLNTAAEVLATQKGQQATAAPSAPQALLDSTCHGLPDRIP